MINGVQAIADRAIQRLQSGPDEEKWAGCAVLWTRLWFQARPAWQRWPTAARSVLDGLEIALGEAVGVSHQTSRRSILEALESLDIEDDGSAEWQHVVDLTAILSSVVRNGDPNEAVEITLRTVLEGAFNIAANDLAVSTGRPVSQVEAQNQAEANSIWRHTVAVVENL